MPRRANSPYLHKIECICGDPKKHQLGHAVQLNDDTYKAFWINKGIENSRIQIPAKLGFDSKFRSNSPGRTPLCNQKITATKNAHGSASFSISNLDFS